MVFFHVADFNVIGFKSVIVCAVYMHISTGCDPGIGPLQPVFAAVGVRMRMVVMHFIPEAL